MGQGIVTLHMTGSPLAPTAAELTPAQRIFLHVALDHMAEGVRRP